MHADPDFWSDDNQYVEFPRDRFLEHTDAEIKDDFLELETGMIGRIKSLPTLFAVEHEQADTRIGEITDIEVHSTILRVKYRFRKDHYPLTRGVLEQNCKKLDINKSGFEFHRTHWAIKEGDISGFYEEYLNTLTGIAHKLKSSDKKVQLIYSFNGNGKTRLSRKFKELVSPKPKAGTESGEDYQSKVLYYNAFTEDLFYWDNDLHGDTERKLIIQPNSYTEWVLKDQGQELNATKHFQRYTNSKLLPVFTPLFTEVCFKVEDGSRKASENIKISKGEESNFIWSLFFSMMEEIVSAFSEPESEAAGKFNHLDYIYIDDPVSSLDENHLIQAAVDLAQLIKSDSSDLKFIISTHNPLFFNVLSNEFRRGFPKNWKKKTHSKHLLEKTIDGSFVLADQISGAPFSYHLFLLNEVRIATETGNVRKYHFGFMRNILEKTSTFLGYERWEELLPKTSDGTSDPYAERLTNYGVHSKQAGDEIEPIPREIKSMLKVIYEHFINSGHTFIKAAEAEPTQQTETA